MSDMYAVKASTLTTIGDAIRSKVGIVLEEKFEGMQLSRSSSGITINPNSDGFTYKYVLDGYIDFGSIQDNTCSIKFYIAKNSSIGEILCGSKDSLNGDNPDRLTNEKLPITIITDTPIYIHFFTPYFDPKFNFNITITPLDENGNDYKYTPLEMAEAINEIVTIPNSAFNISGSCMYKFSYDTWNWFIEVYGDKITTNEITNASYMFSNSENLTEIPFDINLAKSAKTLENTFQFCNQLKAIPNVVWKEMPTSIIKVPFLFGSCCQIVTIPEWFIELAEHNFNTAKSIGSWTDFSPFNSLFGNCENIREIPARLMAVLWNPVATGSYYTLCYSKPFTSMYRLDELVNLPFEDVEFTSNQFSSAFGHLQRLKRFTMITNEDGSPVVRKWKSQTWDLTTSCGYGSLGALGADKEVKDDATYQALKNDPDYWAIDINYSRYNHDSAVETINSLPDTSAYGTNTIKFKGASGALTDGGAINTLTEEEIAVATAKGWTVTLS